MQIEITQTHKPFSGEVILLVVSRGRHTHSHLTDLCHQSGAGMVGAGEEVGELIFAAGHRKRLLANTLLFLFLPNI